MLPLLASTAREYLASTKSDKDRINDSGRVTKLVESVVLAVKSMVYDEKRIVWVNAYLGDCVPVLWVFSGTHQCFHLICE